MFCPRQECILHYNCSQNCQECWYNFESSLLFFQHTRLCLKQSSDFEWYGEQPKIHQTAAVLLVKHHWNNHYQYCYYLCTTVLTTSFNALRKVNKLCVFIRECHYCQQRLILLCFLSRIEEAGACIKIGKIS